MLTEAKFRAAIVEMISRAETTLPADILKALKQGRARERTSLAKLQFDCMLKNLELARKLGAPICQDTGAFTFFVQLGSRLKLNLDLKKSITKAVTQVTREVPLRANIVDPLTRKNTGANVSTKQPSIHLELVPGKKLLIDLLIKGAGTENWSRFFMARPTEGERAIGRAVLLTLSEAGGQPCPPTIVGVGVGGSAEIAPLLAKRALLRPLGRLNPDAKLAKLERRLTQSANELGIGPMGLGGRTTALGVHVEKAACHTASLPIAVALQCWVARRGRARLINGRLRVEVP
jgi:fumarate hydratase subunit alpha